MMSAESTDTSFSRRLIWLFGGAVNPSYLLTRWLFLRAFGFIYFVAFASLVSQITGLVGSKGIEPASNFFQRLGATLGPTAFWRVPSLFWLNQSDSFLLFICGCGVVLSILVIF